jgi:hypothetical protein
MKRYASSEGSSPVRFGAIEQEYHRMGVERIVVSAKLDEENRDWLEYLKSSFYPFSITTSGLVNSLLTVLRLMAARDEINLTPEGLQLLSRKDRALGMRPQLPNVSPLPVLPESPKLIGPHSALLPEVQSEKKVR